jgi:4-amino-4-deoxy-L-arabinose transferase-like glycosyltransferase
MPSLASIAANRSSEGSSPASRRPWRSPAHWIVLAAAAAAFLVGVGARSYETRDVSRYAEMVLEMQHHDSLVPVIEGIPYHGAAPLAAWAPYASVWLSGQLSPFAVRLPAALAAVALCALVLGLGTRCSPRAGRIAVAAIVLDELTLSSGRGSRIEMLLAVAVAVAVIAFFAGARAASPRRQRLLYALSGVGMALGLAAKGPAALALVAAALGPVLVYERRWRAMLEGGAIALGVAIALTAAWLVPYVRYLGPAESEAFFRQFVLAETLEKITDGYGKAEPFWTYAVEIPPKLAPWSIAAGFALWRVLRRPGEASAVERLCASWLLFPLLLLSVASGKHMRYVVPLMPALAVLAGAEIDRWLAAARIRSLRGVDGGLAAIGGLLLAAGLAGSAAFALLYGPGLYALLAGSAVALAGAAMLRLARQGRRDPALLSFYVGMVAVVVFAYAAVLPLPVVAGKQSYVRLAERLAPHLPPSDAPLWLVEPEDRTRAVVSTELALHLGNRWVERTSPRELPDRGLILSPELLPGCSMRASFLWRRGRHGPRETWYLLDRGDRVGRGGRSAAPTRRRT